MSLLGKLGKKKNDGESENSLLADSADPPAQSPSDRLAALSAKISCQHFRRRRFFIGRWLPDVQPATSPPDPLVIDWRQPAEAVDECRTCGAWLRVEDRVDDDASTPEQAKVGREKSLKIRQDSALKEQDEML